MSQFEQYHDTPYQITNEGEQISVKLTRIDSTSGQITWNLPQPTGNDQRLVYDGALITIDDSPTAVEKQPVDGETYTADPSADPSNHLGDKLGTALIVGYIINDPTTTKIIITDLDPNKSYYVTLHAISNVRTYHNAGVHSYSVPYLGKVAPDSPARQLIRVGDTELGVELTDATGLDPTETYLVDMVLDNDERTVIEFDGTEVQTYGDLIDAWNKIAQVSDNSLQSPTPPNKDGFFYNTKTEELQQWDGEKYISKSVLVTSDQPNVVAVDDLWFNPSVPMYYIATNQSGTIVWQPQHVIQYPTNPDNPECDAYWYDITNLYQWSGHAWLKRNIHIANEDPTLTHKIECNAYWFNENTEQLNVLGKCENWKPTLALLSDTDPTTPMVGALWVNEQDNTLFQFDGSSYETIPVRVSTKTPGGFADQEYWYNPDDMSLSQKQGSDIVEVDFILWDTNPTQPSKAMLWWKSTTDTLKQWDDFNNQWNDVSQFFISPNDPTTESPIPIGDVWSQNERTFYRWDGSDWTAIDVIHNQQDPNNLQPQTLWDDGKSLYQLNGTEWVERSVIISTTDIIAPSIGHKWLNPNTIELYEFDGSFYQPVTVSTTHLKPTKGFKYYNTTHQQLLMWNGYGWVETDPKYTVSLQSNGKFIRLQTNKTGSSARVEVEYARTPRAHTMPGESYQLAPLFTEMNPPATPLPPEKGGDGFDGKRSYEQLGVGTDGTTDQRRELIDFVRHQLGYPTVQVELTKQQMNYAIDMALESLRKRSGMAYKLGYQFLDVKPHIQKYRMTDKRIGYNKIAHILKLHRITSSFLSHAAGQGVYGQLALQHLYHMGSFDLVSYHMVSQYIETMEHLFATQITFTWNEDERLLSIFKDLYRGESILMEVAVERTEQEMITDRFLRTWIKKYALAQSRLMLAEIRGKYASLPGSGGGVSLNAQDLYNRADMELMDLYDQIDTYIANDPDNYGMGAHFIIG